VLERTTALALSSVPLESPEASVAGTCTVCPLPTPIRPMVATT
jgi:hypothetical protein